MFVKTAHGKIAYETYGENKNRGIVFIHGFPFDKSMWHEQGRLISNDHFGVAFDLRGHGESDVGSGQYLVEFIVDDLFEVMDHVGLKKAVVCGLSIGGYAAMRATDRDPTRISGLILCNTKSSADTNASKLNRANQIRMILARRKSQFADDMAQALFAPESFRKNKTAVHKIVSIMRSTDETALIGTQIALAARMDMTESLEKISVPTLIITGEKDKVAPQADAELMRSKIKNSKFVLVRGAGHLSNLENASEFNSALVGFLKDNNI
ncbi:MAG TPA: alpha/beta fold hydrolase [Candidatus Acidoferrales bacterium]|nr:alpha/beta fold hydrolase [Candidatus Acidoferrales bacterium]